MCSESTVLIAARLDSFTAWKQFALEFFGKTALNLVVSVFPAFDIVFVIDGGRSLSRDPGLILNLLF